MAFTLTYSDGQETDYDDDTAWEVDHGVVKMGRSDGDWSVYVSPSHWAVLEVGRRRQEDAKKDEDDDEKSAESDASEKSEKSDADGDDDQREKD